MSFAVLRSVGKNCLYGSRASSYSCSLLLNRAISSKHISVKCNALENNHRQFHFSKSPLILKAPTTDQLSTVRASSSGDHVKLWTAERFLSAALLGIIPVAVVFPTPAVETLLALSLTVHSHWGIEAIVHDYVRPAWFGNVIPKLAVAGVFGLSATTFGCLAYFIQTDVGLINAVQMLFSL